VYRIIARYKTVGETEIEREDIWKFGKKVHICSKVNVLIFHIYGTIVKSSYIRKSWSFNFISLEGQGASCPVL